MIDRLYTLKDSLILKLFVMNDLGCICTLIASLRGTYQVFKKIPCVIKNGHYICNPKRSGSSAG